MKMLSAEQLRAHADAWISKWNRHDVDAVLEDFADGVTFISAMAAPYTGGTVVRGKAALGQYWHAAIADRPDLRFELLTAICDVETQTVVVHYVASVAGKRTRACEIMRFDDAKQVYGEALYGVPAESVDA